MNGKIETFLTCRGIAAYLWKAIDKSAGESLEENSLKAVHKALGTNNTLSSIRLLLSELPSILALDYPVVQDIRQDCINLLPQVMDKFRDQNPTARKDFLNMKYLLDMLKTFDVYNRR